MQGPRESARFRVDSKLHRSYHPGMPIWRCPQCGTPQAETSKCWVCRRSSTACGSCGNFRRSVAGQLGYCGIDRQRRPLRGDEIRSCWEAAPPPIDVAAAGVTGVGRRSSAPLELLDDRTPVRKLEFVEVPTGSAARSSAAAGRDGVGSSEPVKRRDPDARRDRGGRLDPSARLDADTSEASDMPVIAGPAEPRWSLWGDVEG